MDILQHRTICVVSTFKTEKYKRPTKLLFMLVLYTPTQITILYTLCVDIYYSLFIPHRLSIPSLPPSFIAIAIITKTFSDLPKVLQPNINLDLLSSIIILQSILKIIEEKWVQIFLYSSHEWIYLFCLMDMNGAPKHEVMHCNTAHIQHSK